MYELQFCFAHFAIGLNKIKIVHFCMLYESVKKLTSESDMRTFQLNTVVMQSLKNGLKQHLQDIFNV